MRWPWVSRTEFARLVERAEQAEAGEALAQQALEAEKGRYEVLLEKYHGLVQQTVGMRREGLVADPVYPTPQLKDDALPAPVERAILDTTAPGRERRALRAMAREELKAGANEKQLAQRITTGQEVEV